jgi:hypothetical protein
LVLPWQRSFYQPSVLIIIILIIRKWYSRHIWGCSAKGLSIIPLLILLLKLYVRHWGRWFNLASHAHPMTTI